MPVDSISAVATIYEVQACSRVAHTLTVKFLYQNNERKTLCLLDIIIYAIIHLTSSMDQTPKHN